MSIYPSEKLLETLAPLVPVPYCEAIVSHIAPDFFKLWDEYEKEQKCVTDVPYWAAVWPGAKLLAAYFLKNPTVVTNKKVLDFGCGSGAGAIAAMKAGAKEVLAIDIDKCALYMTQRNARANDVVVEISDENLLVDNKVVDCEMVIVSDMFYERATAKALHEFLKRSIKNGAEIIIADGTRPFTPREDLQEILCEIIPVNKALEGIEQRKVHLFRMIK
jgi:predicted nicotinamide N-methyase